MSVLDDLRSAARAMARRPGVTIAALLTLAIGIGANTTIFSVIEGVLIRPLPYRDAGRLVYLFRHNAELGVTTTPSRELVRACRELTTSLEQIETYSTDSLSLIGDAEPDLLTGARVSAGFFSFLGVKPFAGRLFHQGEDAEGRHRVAVLSHGLWRSRYGGDPAAVGQPLSIDGEPYTIIGVLPPRFRLDAYSKIALWIPDARGTAAVSGAPEEPSPLHTIARLAPGVSVAAAQAEVEAISRSMPAPDETGIEWSGLLETPRDRLDPDLRTGIVMLQLAVSFVLLIACVNVAHLMLAQGEARRRELAVRAALGASRTRLVRQLLTESILLGLLAGALGLALAVWGVGAIPSLYPGDLGSVRLSWVHLGFTVVVAMVTGLLFGLLPARRGSRPDLRSVLQRNLSGAGGRVRWLGFRQLLVTTEVALALVLLIGAGLLIRSFVGLSRLDPGFRTENLLTLCLELPETRYATGSEQVGFYETLLETIRAGAGDQLVGVTATTGLASGLDAAVGRPEIEGRPADPSSPPQFVVIVAAMSDYFRTMGIPLRSGRGFTTGDREATEPVIVINETLAERCLPGESPLGRRIRFNEQWYRIVGVVADMRLPDLVASGVGELQVYFPAHQAPDPRMTLVVRTTGDPGPLAGTLKARLWSIDPQVAVTRVATGDALLASSLASHRFNALLMVLFSAVAALLAVVGVYGVVAHSVSRSTHEIGIRLALGATSGDILGHLIRRSMAAVALGLAAGVAAALALARALAGLLHDVSARDPATFAVLTVLVATLALVATWIPARRATRLDPLGALRRE